MGAELSNPRRIAVLSAHEGSASWRAMLDSLEKTGRVTIERISGYSDNEYRTSNSRTARAMLRIKTFVLFPIEILRRARDISRSFDSVIAVTSPFFLPAVAASVIRGPRLVILQNDIYPEALIVRNMIRRGGFMDRFLSGITTSALRRADTVVYITSAHRMHVNRMLQTRSSDVVIPVPAHLPKWEEAPVTDPSRRRIVALYTGTLGLMHDTSTFIEFLGQRGSPPRIQFVFRTSGAGKASFERALRAKLSAYIDEGVIDLGDAVGDAEWATMMRSADIGLVFQDVGAGEAVFPSKAASVLVSGQALLAIADPQSALGQLVSSSDSGWVVRPGDLDGLNQAFEEAIIPGILQRKKANSRQFGSEHFSLEVVAGRWLDILTR